MEQLSSEYSVSPNDAYPINDSAYCTDSETHTAQATKPQWLSVHILIPPLSREWQQAMEAALASPQITWTKISNINESSLRRLQPNTMINDEVVEGYISLLRNFGVPIGTSNFFRMVQDRQNDMLSLTRAGQMLIPVHDSTKLHWSFFHVYILDGDVFCTHYDSYYHSFDSRDFMAGFIFHFGHEVGSWKFRPGNLRGNATTLIVAYLSCWESDFLYPGPRIFPKRRPIL